MECGKESGLCEHDMPPGWVTWFTNPGASFTPYFDFCCTEHMEAFKVGRGMMFGGRNNNLIDGLESIK